MIDVLDRTEKALRLANIKSERGEYEYAGKTLPAVIVRYARPDLCGAYRDMAEWATIRDAARPCIGIKVSLIQSSGKLYIVRKRDYWAEE